MFLFGSCLKGLQLTLSELWSSALHPALPSDLRVSRSDDESNNCHSLMKLPFEEHGLGGRTEAEKKDEKGPESRAAYPSLLDRLRLLSSLSDQSGLPAFGTLEGSTGGLLERTRRNGGKGHPCPKGNVLEGLPSDSFLVQVDSLAPSSPV